MLAGDVAVRAVGTAFSVRPEEAGVDVLVTEGRVTIARRMPPPVEVAATPPTAPVLVNAGCRASVPSRLASAGAPALAAEISAALAWRHRRIEFSGTPLREAIEHFNTHNRLQLSVADTRTGARKITGIFWSDDPEGFARLFQLGLTL